MFDKISKKVTGLVAGIMLSIMVSVPALKGYAYDIGYSDDPCSECHDTSVWVREEYEGCSTSRKERKCIHHTYGTDLELRAHYIIYYHCNECRFGWTEDVYRYYWSCQAMKLSTEDISSGVDNVYVESHIKEGKRITGSRKYALARR